MAARRQKGVRPRGRPAITDDKIIEMRIAIEKVARKLFQDQGYGQVSIRKIAKEIGCSPMTLYKYYDSKIAILRTLWADIFNEAFDLMEENEPGDSSAFEHLNTIASIYVGYWLKNTDHYRLVFMAEGVTQSDVSLFVENPEIAYRYQVFSEAIAKAHQDQLSAEILKLKSDALICCLHGIAHNKITISAYPWGDADDLILSVLNGVIAK